MVCLRRRADLLLAHRFLQPVVIHNLGSTSVSLTRAQVDPPGVAMRPVGGTKAAGAAPDDPPPPHASKPSSPGAPWKVKTIVQYGGSGVFANADEKVMDAVAGWMQDAHFAREPLEHL